MEDRKVGVRIYGQDYTISGERDEQTIVEIAAYVDAKMRESEDSLQAARRAPLRF